MIANPPTGVTRWGWGQWARTGHLAGSTTITASFTDNSGNPLSASCTVYVTVADSLYYIKNAASGLYLQDGDTLARTFAKETDQTERIPQLWKITHISHGNYSIRPIDDLSRALYVTPAGSVCTNDAAIADGGLNSMARWQIRKNNYGYAFMQGGLTSKTMTPIGTTANSLVNAKAWSASAISHWELEEAKGIFFRDNQTLQILDSAKAKDIEINKSVTLADIGLALEYYGSLNGDILWSSSNPAIASVGTTGTITTVGRGKTTVTITANIGGTQYMFSFTVICFKSINLEVIYDNAYYTRYTEAVDRIFNQLLILKDHYFNTFFVKINLVSPQLFLSFADEYCYSSPTINCDHGKCFNSLNTTTMLSEYHHKNISNIAFRIPLPDLTESFKMAFIGHNVCRYSEAYRDCYRIYEDENQISGVTYPEIGLALITDHTSQESETVTIVHEFGHFFNGIDHYDDNCPSTDQINDDPNYGDNFSENCIYGENKDNANIMENLTICDGCMEIIQSYIDDVNHD